MTSVTSLMNDEYTHNSVLLKEAVEYLAVDGEGKYLDATLGLGGHAEAILQILAQGHKGIMIGTDVDPEAIERASSRLADYAARHRLIRANFRNLGQVLDELGIDDLSGALFDLGVSSLQLDKASRGFSIMREGPLDMRLDPGASLTAAQIVNEWPAEQLSMLFREYADERRAGKIAKMIVAARETQPFVTTAQLAALIESKIHRTGRTHPATRVFQALRIAVNQELENLTRGLEAVIPRIQSGGRLVVISFHSIEDRIVKNVFRSFVADGSCKNILSTPLSPSDAELNSNARARSAKLRVVEKI